MASKTTKLIMAYEHRYGPIMTWSEEILKELRSQIKEYEFETDKERGYVSQKTYGKRNPNSVSSQWVRSSTKRPSQNPVSYSGYPNAGSSNPNILNRGQVIRSKPGKMLSNFRTEHAVIRSKDNRGYDFYFNGISALESKTTDPATFAIQKMIRNGIDDQEIVAKGFSDNKIMMAHKSGFSSGYLFVPTDPNLRPIIGDSYTRLGEKMNEAGIEISYNQLSYVINQSKGNYKNHGTIDRVIINKRIILEDVNKNIKDSMDSSFVVVERSQTKMKKSFKRLSSSKSPRSKNMNDRLHKKS